MTPPFVTAFSENQDSLPMWKAYGQDGKGVAIGIEMIPFNKSNFNSNSGFPVWVRCCYDSKRLRDIFALGIKEIYDMFEVRDNKLDIKGFPNFTDLSAYYSMLKNFAFEYEQEWRLVKNYSISDTEKEIHFNEKDGILKPYVEYFLPTKALKEIVIGPCSDFEILKRSLKMSLTRAGYTVNQKTEKDKSVKLKISKIPFRNI